MSAEHLSVTGYEEKYETLWDKFVAEDSVNGTFLQTRRFLSYHPAGRFQDCSYIVWNEKGEIVAVCPACKTVDNGETVLYSHMGSTYGGVIIRNGKWYKTRKVIEVLKCLEEKWKEDGNENLQEKRKVAVRIEGAGTLQGYGSANPCCEGSYQDLEWETYDGYVMAVVRSGKEAGIVRVRFTAEGCEEKSIEIQVQKL